MKGAFALTPSASRDIDDIFNYVIDHSGPERALNVHARLFEACLTIAAQPGFVGHARDDLADESLRVLPVFSFLVVFRPQTRPVEIVRSRNATVSVASCTGGAAAPGMPTQKSAWHPASSITRCHSPRC